jgi:hypothetical protein
VVAARAVTVCIVNAVSVGFRALFKLSYAISLGFDAL